MHAHITILGTDSKIEGDFPKHIVTDVTSYYAQGYQYTPRYKAGTWDGRIRLYRPFSGTFPAGLTDYVVETLREHGARIIVDDTRYCPPIPPITKDIFLHGVSFDYPFDFQLECMEKMILKKRGVIHAATNAGKSVIYCLVTACLRLPTLIIVPGKDLLYQIRDKFISLLKSDEKTIGIIGDGKWNPGTWVTVGTVQSLYSKLDKSFCKDFLNRIQLLFSDECHMEGSGTYYEVVRSCNAFFKFGGSGTPMLRTDGANLKLIAATGPVIYQIRNKDLIERGISNKVEIQFIKIDQPFIPKKTPYHDVYKEGITENLYRNRVLCCKAANFVHQGKSVVILVREISHGHDLDSRLWTFKQKQFIPHQFISGKESSEVRQTAIKDFKKGTLKVLIATSIMDQGIDIPNIDVLILGGGLKSSIKTLQRLGRGLRKGGTSDTLIVVDTQDYQHKYLLEHSIQRIKDYINEDCFTIKEVKVNE